MTQPGATTGRPRRGGLGRGLGALLPAAGAEDPGGGRQVAGARFAEVAVEDIEPNPRQPRVNFDAEALQELVSSIQEVGLLQPVVVRPAGSGRFELVMGERRWRAAQEAGLSHVPAIVRETGDDVLLRDALLENLHREQLNPLEEAAAYEQLLAEFGVTHEQLAQRVGKSRSHVSNTLRLTRLGAAVQRRLAAGVLSAGHARALLGLEDLEQQGRMAERVVAQGWSVRTTEEAVAVAGQDRPPRPRSPRPGAAPDPRLEDVGRRLSDRFDTRVQVSMGRRKGRLTVEFAGEEDLDRILTLLGA